MAKWNVTPGSVGNTMSGGFQYEGTKGASTWQIAQDINPFINQAEQDRKEGDGHKHYTKMYSIPEIVAIELKTKYGIDVFSPQFMHDKALKTRVHLIIQRDYPKLMSTDKRI